MTSCKSALACGKLPWEEPHDFRDLLPPTYTDPLLPSGRAVTIGIGILCTDGIVIAADSQYTRGPYKGHGPKIFPLFSPIERDDLAVVVVGAGRVAFMKRAVEKIQDALGSYDDPTIKDVREIVEDTIGDFYRNYIYPKPDYRHDQPWFDLILGIWTQRDGCALLKVDDVTVSRVVVAGTGHSTIGMGFSVADYALDLVYESGLSVEDAKFVATMAVKAAKDHVDYCGGTTNVWTIKNTLPHRIHHVIPVEVKEAETYSDDLFQIIRILIQSLDTDSVIDDSIEPIAAFLKDSIIDFRRKRKERKERLSKLRKQLLKPQLPTES